MDPIETPVYSKNPGFVFRKIAGESLLIPIRKQLNQVNSLYVLNETAATIWDRIDGQTSMDDILDKVTGEFEVTVDQLRQDASILIEDLLSIQAIEAAVSGAPR
jgi:Coenzyme PQQ synthesis protein D (PqqD)